jgi:type 2A phosphatase activator TIP41
MGLNRTDPDTRLPLPKTVDAKPYDWTYTSTYTGKPNDHPSTFQPADPEDPKHEIDMAELTKRDPIQFYAEIPLYEDELHDNGASQLTVRVVSSLGLTYIYPPLSKLQQRVMPSCFFVLSRFSLRVDHVLFRTYDTRLYHAFGSNLVILEAKGWEAPYDAVKAVSR